MRWEEKPKMKITSSSMENKNQIIDTIRHDSRHILNSYPVVSKKPTQQFATTGCISIALNTDTGDRQLAVTCNALDHSTIRAGLSLFETLYSTKLLSNIRILYVIDTVRSKWQRFLKLEFYFQSGSLPLAS